MGAFDAHRPTGWRLHGFLSRNRYVSYHVPSSGQSSAQLYNFTPPVTYQDLPWGEARSLAERLHRSGCQATQVMPENVSACREDYCEIRRHCYIYMFADGQRFRELVTKSDAFMASYKAWDWPWLERVRTAAEWSGPAFGLGTAMVIGQ